MESSINYVSAGYIITHAYVAHFILLSMWFLQVNFKLKKSFRCKFDVKISSVVTPLFLHFVDLVAVNDVSVVWQA